MSNSNWKKQVAATSRQGNPAAFTTAPAAPATEAELEAIRYRGAPLPRTEPPVAPGATVAPALPTQTTLTPAAPVTSPASPAGEAIRDIRQPRHSPTPWLWAMAAAGVSTLVAAAWRWLRHDWLFEMSPAEIALQRLDEARRLMNPESAREYCSAVSQIIRSYIEEQLRLRAPQLTTEEFLRELVEGRAEIVAAQRALLGDFLQHCDLAKFAGWRYSLKALADMHGSAIDFVQQSSVTQATATNPLTPPTPAPAPIPTTQP